MSLDTLFTAETPEGIALALRPAGLVPRLYAYLIDLLIRFAVMIAAAMVLAPLGGEYYTHRWDVARWLWDARARGAGRVERWGVDNLPLDLLGLDGWRTQLDGRLAAVADGAAERATG